MSTDKEMYTPQKKDFVSGMALRLHIPGMDHITSFGLFQSKTGEYYIEHKGQRIFKDEHGFRGNSEYFSNGIVHISAGEADWFFVLSLNSPASLFPKIKDAEFIPYAERY